MILMGMGNYNGQQAFFGFPKAIDRGQVNIRVIRIERKSQIQHKSLASHLDLDAGAADLLGSSVNANSHVLLAFDRSGCSSVLAKIAFGPREGDRCALSVPTE